MGSTPATGLSKVLSTLAAASAGLWRRAALGIDIGTHAVKVVALSAGRWRRDYRLEHCAVEPCLDAAHCGADGRAATVQRALPRRRIAGCIAVLGVPDHLTRHAARPVCASLSEGDRYLEAEDSVYRLFPGATDLFFDVVERAHADSARLDLQVVATPGDVARDRLAIATTTGLHVGVLDVDGFALRRALACAMGDTSERHGAVLMLADLGGGHPHAVFCRGTAPLVAIPIAYCLGPLTSARVDVAAAANAVAQAFDAFLASPAAGKIARIVLAGGYAALPGLCEAIARMTGVPTLLADPFATIGIGAGVDAELLVRSRPALLLATGLALRGLLQ